MTDDALTGWGLLSFPPSTGCALARWAMLLYGLEFAEEWHTVPFLQLKSKKLGAPDQFFPVIYKGDKVFSSSKTGLGYLETIVPSDRKLVPSDPEQAKLVNELWTATFDTLGGQAGPWAYSYLLPMRSIMVPVFGYRCPWYEKAFVALLYSTVRNMVGGRVGDWRRYGDRGHAGDRTDVCASRWLACRWAGVFSGRSPDDGRHEFCLFGGTVGVG